MHKNPRALNHKFARKRFEERTGRARSLAPDDPAVASSTAIGKIDIHRCRLAYYWFGELVKF
jgi:hypothetical protein